MRPELILFPAIALAALTFGIGLWFGVLRFRAAKKAILILLITS